MTETTRKYLAVTRDIRLTESGERLPAWQVKAKLDKFRELGGTVYVDHANDRFILLDDKMTDSQREAAGDLFDGYPLEVVELWVGITRHCE